MDIRTSSTDSNSSCHESGSFDKVQGRSNESQHGRKKGSGAKREKRSQIEETVTPSTCRYNLRPRSGRRVESRPTMEMKTQQGGPVRARRIKGRNYNPYIEEQTRSGNKNTIRRGNQQQKDQERQ
ncbi:uncharacterized protein TNCV_911771 [Trichonephila clavipes]|nr:uncharacterized protein TNCV_911771 [Trichonephila clavipes]